MWGSELPPRPPKSACAMVDRITRCRSKSPPQVMTRRTGPRRPGPVLESTWPEITAGPSWPGMAPPVNQPARPWSPATCMVPSAFGPSRTSRPDTPMAGISTRTGGDGLLGGRVEEGAAARVVVGTTVVDGAASGRAGGSPHAPRAMASVSDTGPAATRRSAGTPPQQHAGAEPGNGQHGRAGQDQAHARDGGAWPAPVASTIGSSSTSLPAPPTAETE